jgi:hypothetical protein
MDGDLKFSCVLHGLIARYYLVLLMQRIFHLVKLRFLHIEPADILKIHQGQHCFIARCMQGNIFKKIKTELLKKLPYVHQLEEYLHV